MEQVTFYSWRVEIDPVATAAAYSQFTAPDPTCCNACATFREIVRRGLLPPETVRFLESAGADAMKVQEVWGAPDGGFLNGWWIVVGRLPDGEWDGGADRACVEPVPGFKCWVTGEPSMLPPAALHGQPLVQLEFEWLDPRLAEIEREVWPVRVAGSAT
jgi:hypothetical protein